MTKKIILTKTVFEELIAHLVNIDENNRMIAHFIYADQPEKADALQKFFKQYIQKIEYYMQDVEVLPSIFDNHGISNVNAFPFVIIGSHVEVLDITKCISVKYQLVLPYDCGNSKYPLSFISPLGKEIILKGVSDEVFIATQTGLCNYRIKSIKLV